MEEERHKKLEAGKQKFAEFLKKKSTNDKKRRRRKTDSPISEMNNPVVNENINPNQLTNGSVKSEEINGNNIYDMNDESMNESNVFQLHERLRQRESVIKRLTETLQRTLREQNDTSQSAQSMAAQIEELKDQLRCVSTSFLKRTLDEQTSLQDMECQTEWTEESSIEEMRKQDNESHSTSLSPIFQSLQNCNNWSQSHPGYNSQPHEPDIENIAYMTQTPVENSRLLHVLSDLVKTFIDTEHDIQKSLIDLGIEKRVSNKEDFQSFVSLNEDINERLSETNDLCEDGPDLTPNSNAMYFTPPSGHNEVEMEEDVVLGASRRLRTAVHRILKLLSEMVSTQPEHDVSAIIKKNDDLLSELNEECVRRNKLTTQLLDMEERVKCLENEKSGMSERVIDYSETKRQLVTMRAKVEEYEKERDKWLTDNKRLEEEKCSFAQGLPQLQKKLLDDNEGLSCDVHQLQEERSKQLNRIHALTLECEQLRAEKDELCDEKCKESEDLFAQIEANEKNLLSYRKFIEEQTHERESERDEYNKELLTVTERLKDKEKSETKLRSCLEEMETQISCLTEEKFLKDKQLSDCCSQMKTLNNDVMDLRTQLNQMERENDKNLQEIANLKSKLSALNEALEFQIRINEESQHEVLANNILEQITSKTHQLQSTLGSLDVESESEDTSIDCSYNDIRLLSEKLNALNEFIDKLLTQNNGLKCDLEHMKSQKNNDSEELVLEKESLEKHLTEVLRSNEILKTELNSKHMQLSALKSRLESSIDSSDMKYMVQELQKKLMSEEQKNNRLNFDMISLRQQIDDNCNKSQQLMDELNGLKSQMKTLETEKLSLSRDNDELRLKLSSKEAILQAIRQKAEEKVYAFNQMAERVETCQKTIESFESEKSSLMKEKEELTLRLNSKEAIIQTIRQKSEEKSNAFTKLSEMIDNYKKTIESIQREKCSLMKDNEELRQRIGLNDQIVNSLKNRIQENEFQNIKLMETNDSLNKKISNRSDDRLNAISNQLLWKLKRAISQKNALIHQKKYLLHVLGGFQLTERATLALLANMNVTVEDELPAFQSPRNRFRSAVHCVIAISRMKLMVKKWKVRNQSKAGVVKTVSTHSLGSTNELQTDSTLQEFVNRLQRLHDTLGLRSGQI